MNIGNLKGLKATMPTPMVMKLLAQCHMRILQPKVLLSKDTFTSLEGITVNKTPNKEHQK